MRCSVLFEGQSERIEPLDNTKPFDISKKVVYEAYLRVKANQGAAGVDEQSIEDFEKDLKTEKESLQNLEPNVIGHLLSAAGAECGNTEERRERRNQKIGSAHSF